MIATTTPETARNAAYMLDRLARCTQVRPFRAGDEELVCGSCGFGLVPAHGHLEHDPAQIAALRALAPVGWPR